MNPSPVALKLSFYFCMKLSLSQAHSKFQTKEKELGISMLPIHLSIQQLPPGPAQSPLGGLLVWDRGQGKGNAGMCIF